MKHKKIDKRSSLLQTCTSEFQRFILDNGMVVILKERADIPMVAFNLLVKAGSTTEKTKLGSGLSHYLEHMVANAKKNPTDSETLYQKIQRMGGYNANAYTSYDKTVFHFTLLSEYLHEGIITLRDILQASIPDKKECETEINVILKEMNLVHDNPYAKLNQILMHSMYPNSPYRYDIAGVRNLFTRLTQEDINQYYHQMYSPENMVLSLVGNMDAHKTIEFLQDTFASYKQEYLEPVFVPIQEEQQSLREVEHSWDVHHLHVGIGYPIRLQQFNDGLALNLLASILNETGYSFCDRLYENDRTVYELYSYFNQYRYESDFSIFLKLNAQNWPKAYSIFAEEITRLKKHPIDADVVDYHKKMMLIQFIKEMNHLSSEADLLSHLEFVNLPPSVNCYIDRIKQIHPEHIQHAVQTYFKDQTQNLAKLYPKNTEQSSKNSSNQERKQTQSTLHKEVLANGVRLITQHEPLAESVSFSAVFRGGRVDETQDNQGIYSLMNAMLPQGNETMSKEDVHKTIKQLGNQLSFSNDAFCSYMKGFTLKDDFFSMFDLYLNIISNANFPETELSKFKQEIIEEIKSMDEDIETINHHHLHSLRFKNHPLSFYHLGTDKSISSITSDALVELRKKTFKPDNMTFCVIGNFDKTKLIHKINQWTPSSVDTHAASHSRISPAPTLDDSYEQTFHIHTQKNQAMLHLCFDIDNITTHIPTQVKKSLNYSYLADILTSRLYLGIRSQHGLSYSQYAYPKIAREGSLFHFIIATEKENVEQVLQLLKDEIKLIHEYPASDIEIERAKNSVLAKLIKIQESNEKPYVYAYKDKLGLEHDFIHKLIQSIDEIDANTVQEMAKHCFKEKKSVLAITYSNTK